MLKERKNYLNYVKGLKICQRLIAIRGLVEKEKENPKSVKMPMLERENKLLERQWKEWEQNCRTYMDKDWQSSLVTDDLVKLEKVLEERAKTSKTVAKDAEAKAKAATSAK